MAVQSPSREALRSLQWGRLNELFSAIIPANRFYSAKLAAAGITGPPRDWADFHARIPFTTKAELVTQQASAPPFGLNLTYDLSRYTRFHQTSGTTGVPLRCLDTPESWNDLVDHWTEVLIAAGVTANDRIFFAFSFGPFIGFWLAFAAAQKVGALCIPGGSLSSSARLKMILENQATVLCCTPTYALRLAEVAALENLDLQKSGIKTLVVAGEAGGSISSTRSLLEGKWGARVFDHHGMTEVGPVTYERPGQPGRLQVMEHAFIAEILDPATQAPVLEGELGELVLTSLRRHAWPVIRYRTGDLVRAAVDRRDAGERADARGYEGMILEGGILGRCDEMVIVRGVNVYPTAIEEVVRRRQEVVEYLVDIDETTPLTQLTLIIEPMASAESAELCSQLERDLNHALSLRVPVRTAMPGELVRSEMKGKRWRRRGGSK